MSTVIIETERLLLRQFTADDAQFILELVNSEGWIKYRRQKHKNQTTGDKLFEYWTDQKL